MTPVKGPWEMAVQLRQHHNHAGQAVPQSPRSLLKTYLPRTLWRFKFSKFWMMLWLQNFNKLPGDSDTQPALRTQEEPAFRSPPQRMPHSSSNWLQANWAVDDPSRYQLFILSGPLVQWVPTRGTLESPGVLKVSRSRSHPSPIITISEGLYTCQHLSSPRWFQCTGKFTNRCSIFLLLK